MKKQKSRFWNFWLAFIPGCSEMYMGFMRMGLSLLTAFVGVIVLSVFMNLGELMFIDMIVWFYAFFHARNMAHMSNEELNQMPDEYLFELGGLQDVWNGLIKKHNKVFAIVLIVIGVYLTTRGIFYSFSAFIPDVIWQIYEMVSGYLVQIAVGVGIVMLGVRMVKGKKEELMEEERKEEL
ncbi:MAG: hypothetical protein ACI4HI_06095 [Lachnospiraceae bacterium]